MRGGFIICGAFAITSLAALSGHTDSCERKKIAPIQYWSQSSLEKSHAFRTACEIVSGPFLAKHSGTTAKMESCSKNG
jgi:hypothetical protein